MPDHKPSDYKHCPHCREELEDEFLISAGASARARLRTPENRKGGRPRPSPCEWCRVEFAAGEMRVHRRTCAKRPAKKAKTA